MYRYWRPKPNYQAAIDKMFDTYFKDNFVIGVQIRQEFINFKADIASFFDCALFIEKQYLKECEMTNQKPKPVKWYVACDCPECARGFLKSNISQFNKMMNQTIFGIYLLGNLYYANALFDVEMLSLCDRMVTTGGSTFGFVPAMKNRNFNRPYYLNGNRGMKQCEILNFSRPSVNGNVGYAVFK